MFHILASSEDTGIRAAWGLAATISSVFGAYKILQWDLQRLFLLYPQEEKLMQKDLMILHKLFVPFALKVGTAAPFSAQWRTQNIAMLITGIWNYKAVVRMSMMPFALPETMSPQFNDIKLQNV